MAHKKGQGSVKMDVTATLREEVSKSSEASMLLRVILSYVNVELNGGRVKM